MVASAIYITDIKGKVIISRNYRGDLPANVTDKCVNPAAIRGFRTAGGDTRRDSRGGGVHVAVRWVWCQVRALYPGAGGVRAAAGLDG